MAAATLQALHPDQEIIIGVGISSPVVVGRWHGAPYLAKRPLAHTREYVTLLRECLSGESVSFQGDFYEISRLNMRIISANLVVKLMGFYREKTTMFFTFAFPIILILVFGTIFMSQDSMEYRLCVQDLDRTNASAQSIKTLGLNGKFKITSVDPAINAAQYVRDNKVNLVLVIPKGYERSLMQRMMLKDFNASVTITYIYDPSSSSVIDEDANPELSVGRD